MPRSAGILIAVVVAVLVPLPGMFAISLLLLCRRRDSRIPRKSRDESLVQYPLVKP